MIAEHRPLEDRDRQIIGPDTEILGGKLKPRGRVAIVVDNDENPETYQTVLRAFDEQKALFRIPGTTQATLRLTNDVARRFIRFHEEGYKKILKEEALNRGLDRLTTDHELALSRFIGTTGICYQHSLLSGTMLRMMQNRGDIGGDVSIETSEILDAPGLVTSGPIPHTKVIFTEDEGQRYAIDTHSGVARMPQLPPSS